MEEVIFKPRKIVIETWLPEQSIIDAVKETEDKFKDAFKKYCEQHIKEEVVDGSEDGSADRVETDSGSEEE